MKESKSNDGQLLDVSIHQKSYRFHSPHHRWFSKPKKRLNHIRIGTLSSAIDYAPLYVAQSLGWLSGVGGDVEIVVLNGVDEVIQESVEGRLEFIFLAEPPAIAAQKNSAPITNIGLSTTLVQHTIVREGLPANSIEELVGTRVGLLKGSSSHFGFLRLLEQHGLSENEIELVYAPPVEAERMFEKGEIDAWSVWPPFPQKQLVKGAARVMQGSEVLISSVLSCRNDVIKGNPRLSSKLLEIVQRAKKWIVDHPKDAQSIISSSLNIPADIVNLAWAQHSFSASTDTHLVLADLSFSVQPGEFVSVLGPSGCGKSSLLRLLAGLDVDYQGKICLNGNIVTKPSRDVGLMFQDHRLLPWQTVEQNVCLGLNKFDQELSGDLLEMVGIKGSAKSYPQELSGGMAQRVALSRALAVSPKLLLLDEPFGALDVVTRNQLHDSLKHAVKSTDTTALMVTHDIEEAVYLSDRILVMNAGPASIIRSYKIPSNVERARESQDFVKLVANIRRELHKELGYW